MIIDESVYLADRVLMISRAPGAIIADIPINLPAERSQITTRQAPQFVLHRAQIARLMQHAARASAAAKRSTPARATLGDVHASAIAERDFISFSEPLPDAAGVPALRRRE